MAAGMRMCYVVFREGSALRFLAAVTPREGDLHIGEVEAPQVGTAAIERELELVEVHDGARNRQLDQAWEAEGVVGQGLEQPAPHWNVRRPADELERLHCAMP